MAGDSRPGLQHQHESRSRQSLDTAFVAAAVTDDHVVALLMDTLGSGIASRLAGSCGRRR